MMTSMLKSIYIIIIQFFSSILLFEILLENVTLAIIKISGYMKFIAHEMKNIVYIYMYYIYII